MRLVTPALGVVSALLLATLPGLCADLDDLPQYVRDSVRTVHPGFGKQLADTFQRALGLRGAQLPGTPTARTVEPVRPDWSAAQAPTLPPQPEVGSAALAEARLSVLVAQLAQGNSTAEEWQRCFEGQRLGLGEACAVWRRLQRDYPREAERPGVTGSFWAALQAHVPADARDPAQLPLEDGLALGEVQLWARDAAAARATFEALLARVPEGPTTGRVSRGLLAYRVAQTHEQTLALEEALEWYLRCAEWGTPDLTGGYDVRGEGLVQAARIARRLGRGEEAQAHYSQAASERAGWGRVVAALDLSGYLMREGRSEEACTMLEGIADGSCGQIARLFALSALGECHYRAGRTDAAREMARRAVEAGDQLTGRGPLDLAGPALNGARDLLTRLDEWGRQPVRATPGTIELRGRVGAEPPVVDLVVSTLRAGTLVVAALPDWLAVAPLPEWDAKGDPLARGAYRVTPATALEAGTREGQIEMRLAGQADVALRVPVRLVMAPPVEVVPRECFFGFLEAGERQRQTIVVHAPSGRAFAVERCRVEGFGVEVGEPERIDTAKWRVVVAVAPESAGVIEATLSVETDLPDAKPLKVPIRAHASDE